jgi:hypothetical protein
VLTSFVLTMAIAAPVPVAPPAAAPGPVPRLVEVKAADGKVTIDVRRTEKQKVQVGIAIGGAPGAAPAPPAVATREIAVQKMVSVELGAVKDLAITTADGKKVDVADAVKRLRDGGTVVASADGKPVSPQHLKLFKDDVLVLVSPELVAPAGRTVPGVRPGVRPLPAPAPQVLPANPGGIQLQIQVQPGGGVQVIPLPVAPAPQK